MSLRLLSRHEVAGFILGSALLVWCALTPVAKGDEARVEVATLDGVPVYHWRAFKSVMSDDVDRALVLREFQRKHFNLPTNLVDKAVQEKIAKNADGDTGKFASQLRKLGASPEDFRQFTSEEIIINAMLYQKAANKDNPSSQTRAQWLAGLRSGAMVKRLDK